MTHNLTETFVEKVKPTAAEVFYRDERLRGFALRVNPGGTKSFVLECRVKGRVRRQTLGKWDTLSVAEARRHAQKLKGNIANGLDPTAHTESVTFKALSDRFLEHSRQHGKRTVHQDELGLKAYIPNSWDSRRISDIARDEIVKLHDSIGAERGHYSANRVIALLRAMWNCAIDWRLVGENPAARVRMFKEHKRERLLSVEELQRVNEALLQEPSEYWRAYFPLACMLGPRKSELLAARWEDVDLEQRTWRLPMTKAGRSHLLPLPAAAAAILERLPSRGASEWVFPSHGRSGHLVEVKSAWQRIRVRARVSDCQIHDLRRTLGSWLAAAGFSLLTIGKVLNHVSPVSTSVYARLDLNPIRAALEANAEAMFGRDSDT
jgi:integrase